MIASITLDLADECGDGSTLHQIHFTMSATASALFEDLAERESLYVRFVTPGGLFFTPMRETLVPSASLYADATVVYNEVRAVPPGSSMFSPEALIIDNSDDTTVNGSIQAFDMGYTCA